MNRVYLLDTDTRVAILRGNENVIRPRLAVCAPVVPTEITASELFHEAAKSADPAGNHLQVLEFLRALNVMPIGLRGAQFFGAFEKQLQQEGRLIRDADMKTGSEADPAHFSASTLRD